MYVTFGSCDEGYMDYLRSADASHEGFLTMQTYGPWDIGVGGQMRHLAAVLVALTCLANNAA